MEWYWWTYLIGLGVLLLVLVVSTIIFAMEGDDEGTKFGGQLILMAPLWPLIAPVLLVSFFVWCFQKEEDGSNTKPDKAKRGKKDRGMW